MIILIIESVGEILLFDQPNERYWVVQSCGTVCYVKHGEYNFQFVDEILKSDSSKVKFLAILSTDNVCFTTVLIEKKR